MFAIVVTRRNVSGNYAMWPMSWDLWDFASDSRANRLEHWQAYASQGDAPVRHLGLSCCSEVRDQVKRCVEAAGGSEYPASQLNSVVRENWSHAYQYPSAAQSDVEGLAKLLSEVRTLRSVPGLDSAIALDFYKHEVEGELVNTAAGDLVNRLKYWTSNPAAQTEAGGKLADLMADMVRRHPAYRSADLVVGAPSTSSGASERLAHAVAHRLGLPHVIASETTGSTEESKAGSVTEKQYMIPQSAAVFGGTVIVVDDVYWRGGTMRGVAKAVRDRQAFTVLGLVGARNLRN